MGVGRCVGSACGALLLGQVLILSIAACLLVPKASGRQLQSYYYEDVALAKRPRSTAKNRFDVKRLLCIYGAALGSPTPHGSLPRALREWVGWLWMGGHAG